MPSPGTSVTSPTSTSSEQTSDSTHIRRKSRVSAEHTLNRVRENQRRHRARQRDHVASLEEKLATTEKLLAEARAEIEALKAEQVAANAICQYTQLRISDESTLEAQDGRTDGNINANNLTKHTNQLLPQGPSLDFPTTPDLTFLTTFLPPPSSPSVSLPPGPPPCCSDPPPLPSSTPLDPQCSSCKTRPAPDPSESTTLCAQAFIMISQQNFRNTAPETIRMWLAQGLRRAKREGEGCRVENGALLRLLDYISGL